MEKRIGTITILVKDRLQSANINRMLSEHADIILCRQGLPFHDRTVAVISLIVEGGVDAINALTGRLGRLDGVECKAVVCRQEAQGGTDGGRSVPLAAKAGVRSNAG